MSLDRYQRAWNAEASQVHVTFDPDVLLREVKRSHETFRSMIFWRDVREVGAALVMIPVWLVMGFVMSLPWTWYLTVPALLWIAGFMLVDHIRHPDRPSDPGEPLLFYVKESLAQVEHQIWLLRNVFWWYLLPPSVSLMAFFTHTAWESTRSWWGCLLVTGIFGVFLFLIYGWIYRINQLAVGRQLEPRRGELEKLIAGLESQGDCEDISERRELVLALSGTDANAGLTPIGATWADNWNRIIPSWREVALILVPTVAGAYVGFQYPLADAGPVFFQSVVAAVIPFEIAFFSLWYLSYRRYKGQLFIGHGKALPNAPAIVTIGIILLISILAFAAIFSFAAGVRHRRGAGLDDISAFVDADIEHTDSWLRGLGVFTRDFLNQLHTETKLFNGSPSGTALGWSLRSIDNVGLILEKNGGRNNCSAWIGFAPEYGVGVAVITNCGGPDVDPIGRKLLTRSIPLSRGER